jgi:uncharacterized protein (TIGR00251 family)
VLGRIFENRDDGIEFTVYLTPGSSKEEITGIVQGGLKISIHAKPTNNQANKALIEFISSVFKVAKSKIAIKGGQKSRVKKLFIGALSLSDIPSDVSKIIANFQGIQNILLKP